MKWLLLWPAAGVVFWAIYMAKEFGRYPFGTLKYLVACAVCGPVSWALLLLQKT